eukprot:CAMPEP_0168556228 /NCGR_PEP_ID=MMETSP0413-20121227/8765_1 /TAXON_ID=136452 /ORGANISM="Filamoeba nolandi, Strain NC-AS-23-1" /LENGTH=119 /DNA_ID=CAMNT_0008587149 /DNA_START=36 /DNA_END=395 /DNA_ORIENTATION=-
MDYSKFNPANPRVPEAAATPNVWRTVQPELYMQMERRSLSGNRAYSNRMTFFVISLTFFGAWGLQKLSERGRKAPGTLPKEWKQLEQERNASMNIDVIQNHQIGQPIHFNPQKITEEDV